MEKKKAKRKKRSVRNGSKTSLYLETMLHPHSLWMIKFIYEFK